MTQRRESSSAVLVALIAVVAIGVLFFVAWRFGPGEATTPPLSVVTETQTQTQTQTERNLNSEIQTTDTTDTTATTGPAKRGTLITSKPVKLRVDVSAATTWVKITRLSTGKAIAQKRVPAGASLGGGALEDPVGFAVETGIPENLSLAVNGLTFSLTGTGPWLVTADSEAPHVAPGKIPPPAITEQKG
jgi:cytoskeletal protein RodZ